MIASAKYDLYLSSEALLVRVWTNYR